MGTTDHYGLERIGAGSKFSENGWKYTDADRAQIDRLLYLGAEGHRHAGAAGSAPSLPTLSLTPGILSGSLPAGTRVFYKFTLVDANGFESAPSTEDFVDTPAPIAEPLPPTLVVSTTGGFLLPGQFFYVLSAYTAFSTDETKALNPNYVTVPTGTATNRVTLTLPSLPAGASGWNIYRKKPGDARYQYLASTTSTTTYVDDGSVAEDCNRTVPARNTTNSTNNVTADIGTTPVGFTWKLYRTYIAGAYDNGLVHHIVEETAEGSGIIKPTYVDMGLATLAGKPPASSQVVGGPLPVELTDSAEVSGALPLAAVSAFPVMVEFRFDGAQSAGPGTEVWVCEFPRASIQGVRPALGRGYAPAVQPLIVDMNVGRGAVPVMSSIFSSSGDQPRILVGEQIGAQVVPTARTELVLGDVLTVDRDQVGGGATPTDRDLKVFLNLLVYGYPSSRISFVHPTSPFAPAQVPNMLAWYKAGSLSLSDTDPVASWTDLSGNANHALQATAGARPLFRTAIVNGKPVVRFDGIDDYLRTATFAASINGPVTVLMVVAARATTGFYDFIDGSVGGDLYVVQTTTPAYAMGSSGGSIVATGASSTPDTSFHIIAATYDGADSVLRIDGGAGTRGNVGTPLIDALTIGAHGALAGNFAFIDVAEMFFLSDRADLGDLNGLGGYLGTEYALTWATAA